MNKCTICGAVAPRSASRKGWTILWVSRPGKGTHYYRHCGYCSSDEKFYVTWHILFDAGLDHVRRSCDRLLLLPATRRSWAHDASVYEKALEERRSKPRR